MSAGTAPATCPQREQVPSGFDFTSQGCVLPVGSIDVPQKQKPSGVEHDKHMAASRGLQAHSPVFIICTSFWARMPTWPYQAESFILSPADSHSPLSIAFMVW